MAETPQERGRYLVQGPAGCGNCHSPLDERGGVIAGQDLSGRLVIELPEFTASPVVGSSPVMVEISKRT